MNVNKILRFANQFYSLATAKGLPEDSKELKVILNNLQNLENYKSRRDYAERNLKHLSSGSSRIVYLTNNQTIIKLAKNDKGLAQNKAEANPYLKSKYVNKVLSHGKDFTWIQVPYIEKITEKEFEKLTDLKFKDFGEAIQYGLKDISNNSEKKPNNFEQIEKSDLYQEIKDIGHKFKILPGDLARISSWGKKDNHPILIDSGLTSKIYEDFYEKST